MSEGSADTLPAAPVRRRTMVLGRPASYRETGHGRVAFMTAGLGLSSAFYRGSYPAFAAAGIRLIVPDLPGYGNTPGPRTGTGPDDTATFLLAFADAIGVHRGVWIGHSLGAQAVVEVAARAPGRCAGVVLAGPTGAPMRFPLLRQAAGLAIEGTRAPWAVVKAAVGEYVQTAPSRSIGTWIRYAHHDTAARLRAVKCPALVLAGDRDPVARDEFLELLRRELPYSRIEYVPGATHGLPRGDPDHFNDRVIDFVKECYDG